MNIFAPAPVIHENKEEISLGEYMKAQQQPELTPQTKTNMHPKQKEIVEWLETLLAYAKGDKQWDTSGPWVEEGNILMPFQQGLWFENKESRGPGMPPFTP